MASSVSKTVALRSTNENIELARDRARREANIKRAMLGAQGYEFDEDGNYLGIREGSEVDNKITTDLAKGQSIVNALDALNAQNIAQGKGLAVDYENNKLLTRIEEQSAMIDGLQKQLGDLQRVAVTSEMANNLNSLYSGDKDFGQVLSNIQRMPYGRDVLSSIGVNGSPQKLNLNDASHIDALEKAFPNTKEKIMNLSEGDKASLERNLFIVDNGGDKSVHDILDYVKRYGWDNAMPSGVFDRNVNGLKDALENLYSTTPKKDDKQPIKTTEKSVETVPTPSPSSTVQESTIQTPSYLSSRRYEISDNGQSQPAVDRYQSSVNEYGGMSSSVDTVLNIFANNGFNYEKAVETSRRLDTTTNRLREEQMRLDDEARKRELSAKIALANAKKTPEEGDKIRFYREIIDGVYQGAGSPAYFAVFNTENGQDYLSNVDRWIGKILEYNGSSKEQAKEVQNGRKYASNLLRIVKDTGSKNFIATINSNSGAWGYIKDKLASFFGNDRKKIAPELISSFMTVLNARMKELSGSAVTEQEMKRVTTAYGSLMSGLKQPSQVINGLIGLVSELGLDMTVPFGGGLNEYGFITASQEGQYLLAREISTYNTLLKTLYDVRERIEGIQDDKIGSRKKIEGIQSDKAKSLEKLANLDNPKSGQSKDEITQKVMSKEIREKINEIFYKKL